MHCDPNWLEDLFINSGFSIAVVFIETLSAPASSSSDMLSKSLIPPPTVNGIKTSEETFSTTSIIAFLFSWLAVMSKKTNSSAPSLL